MEKYISFNTWVKYGYFRDKRDNCIYEPGLVYITDITHEKYYCFVDIAPGYIHSSTHMTKKEVIKNLRKVSKEEEMVINAKRELIN